MPTEETINKIVSYFAKDTNVCKIFSGGAFEDFIYKKKNSMSDSEVFFGTYDNRADFAIKMWLNIDEQPNLTHAQIKSLERNDPGLFAYINKKMMFLDFLKGLSYEATVYKYITENIISTNLSPNFIPVLAFGKCELAELKDQILTYSSAPDLVTFFDPLKIYPQLTTSILVTGTKKGSMVSLESALADDVINNKFTMEDVNSIVFQIIHALMLLEHFGIMHNDFHMGNLLLQTLSAPVCLLYNVFDTSTVIKTKYIVKLYDWDRGYVNVLGENPALNEGFSIKTHAVQKFIKNRDLYQFICSMEDFPKFWSVVKKIIPSPEYNGWKFKISNDDDDEDVYNTIGLPKKSADVLKKILVRNPDDVYSLGNWRAVNISKDDLRSIFIDPKMGDPEMVLPEWFGAEKYNAHDTFYFITTPACTKIKILPGWRCQALYNPSKTLLYDLDYLFKDEDLYRNLTEHINNMCDPTFQNTFTFNF